MTAVIEVEGLTKVFRRPRRPARVAVDGLDLVVPEGGVFGFLGPNGSGKTTTIRCLLGLVRASSGRGRILGVDTPARLPEVIGRVGSIVESPLLSPAMTGRRNLALLGRLDGIGPRRVDAVLERVGLGERADDVVRTYSLGMRQRLALAAALLKDPALVVLDEPANGLDPAGIRDIRLLLRELADEGRTVFLSSHLLGEVQQVCDRVAILSAGRALLEGTVADVLAHGAPSHLVVRVDDLDGGCLALRHAGFAVDPAPGLLRVAAGAGEGASVTRALAAANHWVTELRVEEISLEDLFLQVTAGRQEVAA